MSDEKKETIGPAIQAALREVSDHELAAIANLWHKSLDRYALDEMKRRSTEDLIEKAAITIHFSDRDHLTGNKRWSDETDEWRDSYRKNARALFDAGLLK